MILNYANLRIGTEKVNKLYQGPLQVYGKKDGYVPPTPTPGRYNYGDILYSNYVAEYDQYGAGHIKSLGDAVNGHPIGICVTPLTLSSAEYEEAISFIGFNEYQLPYWDTVATQDEDVTYYEAMPSSDDPFTENVVNRHIRYTWIPFDIDRPRGTYVNPDLDYSPIASPTQYAPPILQKKDGIIDINKVAQYGYGMFLDESILSSEVLSDHIYVYHVLNVEEPDDNIYVPDIMQLASAYAYHNYLNTVLEALGGTPFAATSKEYVSCSLHSASGVWVLHTLDGNILNIGKKSGESSHVYLRPFYCFYAHTDE